MNDANPHRQSFSAIKISELMGIDKINAVKKESCRGEMFLGESMVRKLLDSGCWILDAGCSPIHHVRVNQ
jgi:hypothetical protein